MVRTGMAVLVLSVTGCSAGRNLMPSEVHEIAPNRIYGGTQMAAESFRHTPHEAGVGMKAVWPMALVDVIASAFADTFTLPYTLASTLYRHYNPPVVEPVPEYVPAPAFELPPVPQPLPAPRSEFTPETVR